MESMLPQFTAPQGTDPQLIQQIQDYFQRVYTDLYNTLTQNQTLEGEKTFGTFPLTPSAAPDADYEVANKKYIDDLILDEDDMASDSDAHVPTQQSTKAYVDAVNALRVKGWVRFDGTGTLSVKDSYNVDSVTDNGTGNYTVNWDADFANADYCVVVTVGNDVMAHIAAVAAGTTQILVKNRSGTLTDIAIVCVMAIGD